MLHNGETEVDVTAERTMNLVSNSRISTTKGGYVKLIMSNICTKNDKKIYIRDSTTVKAIAK